MSDMKPWGYISPSATKTLLDRSKCDLTITRKATHNITMPLYTADQIAKAVASERERCAKMCDGKAQAIVQEQGSLPDFETGEVTLNELSQEAFEAFENAAQSIRSAAK